MHDTTHDVAGRAFGYRCRRCGMAVARVGRLSDDALRTLADHVRTAHAAVALPVHAGAGAVLTQYDVERPV